MKKPRIRFFVVLLVPCLLLDPVFASVWISPQPIQHQPAGISSSFEHEALNVRPFSFAQGPGFSPAIFVTNTLVSQLQSLPPFVRFYLLPALACYVIARLHRYIDFRRLVRRMESPSHNRKEAKIAA